MVVVQWKPRFVQECDLQDLGQPQLPGWVALQVDTISKQHEEVGFAHDALGELGIDQVHGDVLGGKLALLAHVSQRLCQVDEGATAVRGGQKQDGEVRRRLV